MMRCVLMILFVLSLLFETHGVCHYSYNVTFLKTCEFCFKFISEHGITGGINRKLAKATASANTYLHPTTTGKQIVYERRANGSTAKSEAKVREKATASRVVRTKEDAHRYMINLREGNKDWVFLASDGKHSAYINKTTKEIRYPDYTHGEIESFVKVGRSKTSYDHRVLDSIDEVVLDKPKHELPKWIKDVLK